MSVVKTNNEPNKWLNPPFDPRILNIGPPHLGGKQLKRGYVLLAGAWGGAKKGVGTTNLMGKGVQFLYNPVSVTASHTIDPRTIVGANTQQNSNVKTQVGQLFNIGSISLELLYDRTYECWAPRHANSPAAKFGVYADILAFYKMLGVVQEEQGTTSNGTNMAYSYFDLYPTYPVQAWHLYYVYIGDKMRWYGVIRDFEVTYSHWTRDLVPSRAAVSLTLQFQPSPGQSNGQTAIHGMHKIPPRASALNGQAGMHWHATAPLQQAQSAPGTWNNQLPGFG